MEPMARTRRGRWRPLTAGEAALGAELFGDQLNPGIVRLFAQPLSWPVRAFVAGPRLIVWPWRAALADFSAADAPLAVQAVFVHELTHVWQAQNGVNLLLAKLRAGDGRRAYDYDLTGGPDFAQLNIEQQAMVVQHAFTARRGGRTPYSAEVYAGLSLRRPRA
jgi:hypothetical protein